MIGRLFQFASIPITRHVWRFPCRCVERPVITAADRFADYNPTPAEFDKFCQSLDAPVASDLWLNEDCKCGEDRV